MEGDSNPFANTPTQDRGLALTTFTYAGNNLRVIDRDGAPWFVAIDVCMTLGIQNTTQACEFLSQTEVIRQKLHGVRGQGYL
jgi:prophage antirepressor-like protein